MADTFGTHRFACPDEWMPATCTPNCSAIANVINNKEDAGWGPNAVFR